jgi:diguanylate cyclase (GGDEF)-like protein
MNASDYLTQEVQDFTVTTEKIHLINYFEEAEETKRREKAIEKMKDITGEGNAYKFLHNAMNESLDLMQTEYYAMKLITIACEIEYIPDEVEKVELTKQDAALSNSEKIKLAQRMVHDTTYHRKKEVIRTNMESCLVELEKQTHIIQDEANEKLETRLNNIRVIIFIQLAIIIVILIMTSVLVILPMLRGVYSIKKDEKLPVKGAYEFRYLAKTYNSMYEAFKKSIASLNYEASHDKLTGLYNRAGYDVLSRSVDLGTTAVLMIDADKFKDINDQYGHDVGDKILQKFARVLRKTFRSEDYICRIGGDEFVVFMMHVTDELRDLIILKTKQINSALADASDELPPASASIGIAFGHDAPDMETLLKHADEALYNVKENGRGGGSFYDPGRI